MCLINFDIFIFNHLIKDILSTFILQRSVSLISSEPPGKQGNTRFTTVPLNHLHVWRVQRYLCVNLSKPACISVQLPVYAVLSS